jgi:SAM-dependent methyltransferase
LRLSLLQVLRGPLFVGCGAGLYVRISAAVFSADASKKESNRRYFDRWARRYERDHVSRWLATLQRSALESIALEPSDRVLDVGCGTGAGVRYAAAVVEHAVGVDLSMAMVERARELAVGMANVELRDGDAEALPFADRTFTAVLCSTSLHHYPNAERAVAEMARVLLPGGRVVIADPAADRIIVRVVDRILRVLQPSHAGCHRAGGIEQMLRAAGLVDVYMRPLYRRLYVIVAARKPGDASEEERPCTPKQVSCR